MTDERMAIVWDMGGVFNVYFTQVLADIGRAEGWPMDRIPLGPTGDIPDPDYLAMTNGELTEPEYTERLTNAMRAAGVTIDIFTDVDWSQHDRPETWAFIERASEAGIVQAILTNDASRWMGEEWWQTWPRRWLFDAIVDVATLGTRKPAPETYLAACSAIDRRPDTCVFVDDMPVNCRGAEAVGMQAQLFDIVDPSASLAELEERLGLS